MNCLKCGCEIKYNSIMCLKCYSKIKDDREICLISSLDKKRSDEIEWLFAIKNFGEVSFVEDFVIQVDDDIDGGTISALYTGLLKNNEPYGSGVYFFEDGVRYFGEYSPKGKLVNGITTIRDAYQEGLHENFELREGITVGEDGSVTYEHYDEKEKCSVSYVFECSICGYKDEFDIPEKCPVCHAPADKCNKPTRFYISQDNHFIKLINEKSKLSRLDSEEMMKRGRELLRTGATENAVKFLKYAAQHGNHEAAILVGDCYNNGNGVPKDWKIAEAYYRQAAVSGNHEAEYKLGVLLDVNNGWDAVNWLRKSATAGFKPADDYLLGMKIR